MGGSGRGWGLVGGWALLMDGCGPAEKVEPQDVLPEPPEATTPAPSNPSDGPNQPLPDVITVTPLPPDEKGTPPRPLAPLFQPGFHEGLRRTQSTTTMTYTLHIP